MGIMHGHNDILPQCDTYPCTNYYALGLTRCNCVYCSGNGKLASWGAIFGFIVMMSLDVGLG